MSFIVLKFGGSSICEKGLLKIKEQLKINKKEYDKIIIVVSAIKNTTKNLFNISNLKDENKAIHQIYYDHLSLLSSFNLDVNFLIEKMNELKEDIKMLKINSNNNQLKIKILSYGEILSSNLVFEYLKREVNIKMLNSYNFIKSDNYSYNIDSYNLNLTGKFYCDKNIIDYLDETEIYITQGYISSTKDNKICVLSRSGSDTTASLIASTLEAKKLEIWTDVNGLYTFDPNIIKNSKLIDKISYELCQEASESGARVLHSNCINPCKEKNIPIFIKNTFSKNNEYTEISNCNKITKLLSYEKNITLFKIFSSDMIDNYGIASEVFKKFSEYNIDINIISTTTSSICTTTNEISSIKIDNLYSELKKLFIVELIRDCTIISLITNFEIDKEISKVNNILNNYDKNFIKLSHLSSNNLNYSIVIDSNFENKIINILHSKIILNKNKNIDNLKIWWRNENNLIENFKSNIINEKKSLYIYKKEDIKEKCNKLKSKLGTKINKFYYAMKANYNKDILKIIIDEGFGIECVSLYEIKYLIDLINNKKINLKIEDILFTPNFCDNNEYVKALDLGILCIIDNLNVIKDNLEIFDGKSIGIRLDLNMGDGHNKKVITEGKESKFGILLQELDELKDMCSKNNIKIILLHSHKGSGITDASAWGKTLEKMNNIVNDMKDIQYIDLGGGLGIFDNGKELDLIDVLINLEKTIINKNIKLILEPGRYLVAESGIILTKVNQIKSKGDKNFLGINCGMNNLIRPMLYNSYHPIYNLSKINKENNKEYDIVGPICESGDLFGKYDLPDSNVDDIILIENTGAYGYCMSSNYNLRGFLEEVLI